MREMKCPVCAGRVPRAVIRSGPFPCPVCKELLRIRELSPLLIIPVCLGCGWLLAFLITSRIGLTANGLFFVTFFLGFPVSMFVAGVIGGL